ncbi:MAG: hypothetical protein WCD86_14735, partial [Ktedonobacteraceae bacterium]
MRNPEDSLEELLTDSYEINYPITDCPIDHQLHEYTLKITYRTGIVIQGIVEANPQRLIEFTCPNTQKTFAESVIILLPKDAHLVEVSVIPEIVSSLTPTSTSTVKPAPDRANDKSSDSVIVDEFKAWTSGSPQVARDYAKTMISTATGAVAVFYAVLTFLGIGGGKTSLSSLPAFP